mgnify:CR=1 FL=1
MKTSSKFDICLAKCPDSICLEKCKQGESSLEEKFYDIIEKVLSKGIIIRGETLKIARNETTIEAIAKVDEQTWLMHTKLEAVEGKCRKLRDILFDSLVVQSKLCYENGDYWLKIKYWGKGI